MEKHLDFHKHAGGGRMERYAGWTRRRSGRWIRDRGEGVKRGCL
jgi:hypothetical protein